MKNATKKNEFYEDVRRICDGVTYTYCHRKPDEEKQNYKDFPTISLGGSDVATLSLVGGDEELNPFECKLHFFADGDYRAYLVRGQCNIGTHYTLRAEFCEYMRVCDDPYFPISFSAGKGGRIRVYRAGNFGCIVQLLPADCLSQEELSRPVGSFDT